MLALHVVASGFMWGGVHLQRCIWRGACGGVHVEGCRWRGAGGGVQVEGCRWRGHVGWRDEMCMWTWICAFDHGFDHLISPHLRTLLISDDICEFLQRIIEHCVE